MLNSSYHLSSVWERDWGAHLLISCAWASEVSAAARLQTLREPPHLLTASPSAINILLISQQTSAAGGRGKRGQRRVSLSVSGTSISSYALAFTERACWGSTTQRPLIKCHSHSCGSLGNATFYKRPEIKRLGFAFKQGAGSQKQCHWCQGGDDILKEQLLRTIIKKFADDILKGWVMAHYFHLRTNYEAFIFLEGPVN